MFVFNLSYSLYLLQRCLLKEKRHPKSLFFRLCYCIKFNLILGLIGLNEFYLNEDISI